MAATIGIVVVGEWLLLELLRTPYRPPQDMSTFLGTEKHAVMGFMLVFGLGGAGLLAWWITRSTWSRRDAWTLALFASAVLAAAAILTLWPLGPVTPWRGVFQ